MKVYTIYCFMALAIIAIVPLPAAGELTPILAEDQPVIGRGGGGYAQKLPRPLHSRESIKNDMQKVDANNEPSEEKTLDSDTINSGFVIIKGRYIPPPYAVRSYHGRIYLNELRVQQRPPGPFSRRPINANPPNQGPRNRMTDQIEQHLREDGLLICSQRRSIAFVSVYQAVCVLEILLSDESGEVKVQKLTQTDTPWISSDQWVSLIETFNGPVELSDRVLALKQRQAELIKDDTNFEMPWFFLSGITFSGFILAVLALGTLMSCRPPMLQSSRSTFLPKRACRQVIWLVVLIAVLNMYDLTCTLFATNVGGLWELNPFAGAIVHENSGVVVFKLGLTVGAAILLLVTRRHRLTYIGSWWAGVLYTVLILRWTTFNSMFL